MALDTLPENVVLVIMRYLDYKDLVRVTFTCKRLYSFRFLDSLWISHCSQYWDLTQMLDGCGSWYEYFVSMFGNWGRYIDDYKTLHRAWQRIRILTQERSPSVFSSLLPGLTEEQLNYVEHHLNLSLPNDVRCSYRFCNGQRMCSGSKGLLGYYDVEGAGDFLFPLLGTYHGSVVELTNFNCVPIAGPANHSKLFLCLRDSEEQYLRAGTLFSVARFEEGHNEEPTVDIFVVAQNFKEFIANFAKQLEDFPVESGTILRYVPNSFQRTGFMTVRTETCFARELSFVRPDASRYCYRYRITIAMDADADPEDSCRLETRHWVITDQKGNVERVDGPGVVGKHPVMKPGKEHTWISGTSFPTPYGEMGGYFELQNLYRGHKVIVNCATFHLKAPPVLTFLDRKTTWTEIQLSSFAGTSSFEVPEIN